MCAESPFVCALLKTLLPPQTSPPLLYGPKETLAFVAHRAVPLFGVLDRVLRDVKVATPGFTPKSMLDFGSGA